MSEQSNFRFETDPTAMITSQPWFDLPDFKEKLAGLSLTAQQQKWIRQLREEGFFVIDTPIVDLNTIDETVHSLKSKYSNPPTAADTECRIQDAWRFTPSAKRIVLSQTVLDILKVIYQRNPIPFQSLNFNAPTQQRAHSDTIHFNSLPYGYMCGVWVALEDIDEANGPLFYYRGSQKLPVYHMQDFGLQPRLEDYGKYEDAVEILLKKRGFERGQALIKKGQALVWAANLFHGGSPVIDRSRTRHSQVNHYYFDGALYYTPLLSDPLRGQFTMRHLQDIGTMQFRPQLTLPQTPDLLKQFLMGLMKQVPARARRLFH